MAQISTANNDSVIRLNRWLGLNEAQAGETSLKNGEASVMVNWKVTRDRKLKRRNGLNTKIEFSGRVAGLWQGTVNGVDICLCAADNELWLVDPVEWGTERLGFVSCDSRVFFVPFEDKVYVLDGVDYYEYDGTIFQTVEGYRPLVLNACDAATGSGSTLEGVNLLTGARRAWYSVQSGNVTELKILEDGIASIDWVKVNATGARMNMAKNATVYATSEDYDGYFDLANRKCVFRNALAQAVNGYEVGYTSQGNYRDQITCMRCGEMFSGSTDKVLFLYGNGTNRAVYSSIDYDGNPRGDYFPDLYCIDFGAADTPVTAMIRHYSQLIVYKPDSAWGVQYATMSLSGGGTTTALYSTQVNRLIGNEALGQVFLVLNDPYTLNGSDVYQWRTSSTNSSSMTYDERQAKRISDRVAQTLRDYTLKDCLCWDDNYSQEWYCCYGDTALVYNYAADAWYKYAWKNVSAIHSFGNTLVIGTENGKLMQFDNAYFSDDGEKIAAVWESGAMSFGAEYVRKYSSMLWVGSKPETRTSFTIGVETDKKSEVTAKAIESRRFSFEGFSFENFSFSGDDRPVINRLKLKAKKFVYYKLILNGGPAGTTATILDVDIKVRQTGYAK